MLNDTSQYSFPPALADAHLAAIIESSDDAILSKDLNGIIQSWNPGAERMFGYTASEVIGKSIVILIPAGMEGEEPHIISRIKNGEKIDHRITVRRRKDGSEIKISLSVSPIKDRNGQIVGASKIARDITKQTEAEILQMHYAAIVESSDDAILSKDLNGVIHSWNHSAEKIFGYSASEIVGKPVTMLIPDGHPDEEPAILGRIRCGEKIDHYETVRQRKDGSIVDISLTVSPIKDASGTVIGASKIARDISKLKAAEQTTKATQKELARLNAELELRVQQRTASLNIAMAQMEEFSYSVSHDLRNPLRGIQAYASVLLEDHAESLNPEGKELLGRIVRGTARMDKLILDVLVYSRLAQSQITLSPIHLDMLVKDIILQYEDFRPPKAEITLQDSLGMVLGHESLLTQALSNILGNAVKFVAPPSKPKISIWSEKNGNRTRLWIKDNGVGIPHEFKPRLFGMFERAHEHVSFEGTGVGLAIVRKAMEKMGGTVGIESDGDDGTSVWIELPEAAPQA